MFKLNNKVIQIYLDGPNLDQLSNCDKNLVDGFTFNPTLFKSLGANDYLSFCEQIIKIENIKPVSLEIISDDYETTISQAKKLSSLSRNVVVKVPISFTNGESTYDVIDYLVQRKINLNITAIFTLDQIKKILPIIKDTDSILSVFAGRLYDIGIDAKIKMREISDYVKANSNCRLLWASPRMIYDVVSSLETNTEIITIQYNLLQKLNLFGLHPEKYSLETVKMFYNDALSSNYKI